ncbi:MAG TPA: tetratricopeptide repeat protein, partial [bacterium]|nr:tetratricopeptide repeat protein [bacterium]
TYIDLDECLNRSGDLALQVKMWEEALKINPDRFEPNFHLGILYGHYMQQPMKGVAFLEKAVRLQPMNAEAYNNLGAAYGMLGRPEDAVRTLEHAVQLNPADAQAYANLAVAYRSVGNEAKALECSRKAGELRSGAAREGAAGAR